MARKKRPPTKREITVEVDGESHTGWAEFDNGIVTVSTAFTRKSTQVGGMDFLGLARLMLGEIVREEKRKG